MRPILALAVLLGLGALPVTTADTADTAADAGGEFVVTSSPAGNLFNPDAAMSPRGEALVVWADDFDIEGRFFDRDGEPLGDDFQVGGAFNDYLGPLYGAVDALGFSVVWSDDDNHAPGNSYFRRFGRDGQPLTDQTVLGGNTGAASGDTDRRGNSVAVAVEPGARLTGWRFDAAGRQIRRFRVADRGFLPQVTVEARGRFAAVWFNESGVFLRRFDAAANPSGPPLLVAARGTSPRLAGNDDGDLVVVWHSDKGVQARVYTHSGPRRTVTVTSRPGTFAESVAMDASGRFLVTWSCCAGQPAPRLLGRFFEASGLPLDRPFQVSLGSGTLDGNSSAAAGPAGRFLAVWRRIYVEGGQDLIGRYLAWARAGDDLCRLGPAVLACDVAHDGTTGLVTPAPAGPAGTPLLGDLDGDRRDDLCVYAGGRFRCDTGHDGGAAEV
ncbi:MAG TPA: hypothetical protein VF789_18365, partial [Thermoanaerobaculia bacterium]